MGFPAAANATKYDQEGAVAISSHAHGETYRDNALLHHHQDFNTATGEVGIVNDDVEVSVAQKMLSAVSGSILTSLLVTPLDVVRVRLQSQDQSSRNIQPQTPSSSSSSPSRRFTRLPPNLGVTACCREVFWVNNNASYCVASPSLSSSASSAAAECAAEETERRTINSTLDGLRKIARNEGVTTLWRGLSPTLAMAVPANVIYFAGYDWLRTSAASPLAGRIPDYYAPLAAGSIARMLAAVTVSPIEMFRTRMQAAQSTSTAGHFRETLYGLRELVGVEGYRALWRGLGLTLWRDVPFSAIYWWGYEAGRNSLSELRASAAPSRMSAASGRPLLSEEDHSVTLIDSFIAGAGSGALAALITTPFDVGKTKQQVVQQANSSSSKSPSPVVRPEEQSMPRFLWHIFREQGLPGLFKGWAARCLKVAPACAIMISSYEVGKKMAGRMNARAEGEKASA